MSFTFQYSKRLLYFLIIVLAILEIAILFAQFSQLSPDVIVFLWYASFAMIFLIAITWVAYRHSKNKQIEEEEARARQRPAFTPTGEDPRIGHTYEWRDGKDGRPPD